MTKNIALLCGRGGSVSVRDKNLYPVLGRPMMMYPLLAAKAAKHVDETFLSTDSERMKALARENGVSVIDRPVELATATAQHVPHTRVSGACRSRDRDEISGGADVQLCHLSAWSDRRLH